MSFGQQGSATKRRPGSGGACGGASCARDRGKKICTVSRTASGAIQSRNTSTASWQYNPDILHPSSAMLCSSRPTPGLCTSMPMKLAFRAARRHLHQGLAHAEADLQHGVEDSRPKRLAQSSIAIAVAPAPSAASSRRGRAGCPGHAAGAQDKTADGAVLSPVWSMDNGS